MQLEVPVQCKSIPMGLNATWRLTKKVCASQPKLSLEPQNPDLGKLEAVEQTARPLPSEAYGPPTDVDPHSQPLETRL